MNQLYQFQKDGKFTDFVIVCTDGRIPVHKMFLASSGIGFQKIFECNSIESQKGEIDLKCSTSVANYIISHIYLHRSENKNPVELVEAVQIARMYLMDDVLVGILFDIRQMINKENVSKFLEIPAAQIDSDIGQMCVDIIDEMGQDIQKAHLCPDHGDRLYDQRLMGDPIRCCQHGHDAISYYSKKRKDPLPGTCCEDLKLEESDETKIPKNKELKTDGCCTHGKRDITLQNKFTNILKQLNQDLHIRLAQKRYGIRQETLAPVD